MENQEKKHTSDNFYDWVRHEKFAIGLALFALSVHCWLRPSGSLNALQKQTNFLFYGI